MNRLGTLVLASVVWVVLALFATSSIAAPQGVVNLGQKLFQFNVIAKPGPWDQTTANACNGARIFFGQNNAGPHDTMGEIHWVLDPSVPGFEVTNCNGVTDPTAPTVTANENLSFAIVIRVQGPVTSALTLTCSFITQNAGDTLCVIGTQKFSKGNSFTTISVNVGNALLENILWTFSGDWKIFQVRLYALQ